MSTGQNPVNGNVNGGTVTMAENVHGGINGVGTAQPLSARGPVCPPRYLSDQTAARKALETHRDACTARGEAATVILRGGRGTGKTALAAWFAHKVASDYPDGQLWVSLGDHADSELSSVLEQLLVDLGADLSDLTRGYGARLARYRALTRDKRFLLVLDGISHAFQVQALVPESGRALVIGTTEQPMPALAMEGAQFVDIGRMEDGAIADYLDRTLPPEWLEGAPEDAVERLSELCRGFPGVADHLAARLWHDPLETYEELVAAVGDTGFLEQAGGYGRWLDSRIEELSPEGAHLFSLLGLAFGTTVDREALASVLPGPLAPASTDSLDQTLGELRFNTLLTPGEPSEEESGTAARRRRTRGRFLLDVLVAEKAELRGERLPAEERARISRRFAEYLAEVAVRAGALITRRWSLAQPAEDTDLVLPAISGADGARDWMRANMGSLRECVRWAEREGEFETVGRIAESAESYLRENSRPTERVELLAAGLRAARALGDTPLEARVRNLLGLALLGTGDLEGADTEFVESLALAEADGDDRARAAALECRGIAAQHDRRDEEALVFFDRVEPLKAATGRPRVMAVLDLLRGRSLVTLGRFDHALERLDAALEVFAAPEGGRAVDEVNVAKVRLERGRALNAKRRTGEARDELELSLAGFGARGHTAQVARVREALAGVAQLSGEKDWKDHLVEAERLYREVGNETEAARVRTYIG